MFEPSVWRPTTRELLPALLDHVVAAFDHLVEVPRLQRDVVEPDLVGTEAEEQVVVLDVAFALHEGAGIEHMVDRAEAQPADIEIDRLLASGLRDVQGDMQEPDRTRALIRRDGLVPAIDVAQHVVASRRAGIR